MLDSLTFAGFALGALMLHLWVLGALGPRIALGDEADYLARGHWPDPHVPRLFLRVPLMPAWAKLATRLSRDPESMLRLASTAVGAAAAVFVALAGHRLGGAGPGLLAGMLMLLLVERVLLSAHLWPDTLLCGLHALSLWLLQFPPSLSMGAMLGLVALLACLLRIEQLSLALGLLLVAILRQPGDATLLALLILGPSLLALLLWTWNAWRRYGIPLPDTTWLFNLRILHGQLGDPEGGPVRVQGSIVSILHAQRAGDRPGSHLTDLLGKLPAVAGSMLRRLLACFGPDTFVTGRLLPPMGTAYPTLPAAHSALLAALLRWGFPLLASLMLWSLVVLGQLPDYLLAAAPVLLALVVVHFRSRYRLVLMPWLCLAGADALLRIDYQSLGVLPWTGLGLLLLLAALQVRHPLIVEHDDQIGAPRQTKASES